jgi:hypothetical protein
MKRALPLGLLSLFVFQVLAESPTLRLKIDQVMTPQELRDTGVSTLSVAQKQALDHWLNRYTVAILKTTMQHESATSEAPFGRSSCSPAVESTISGEIEGWDGDTIFKLDNGQIWQQAAYDYTYFYAYRPEVTIYQTNAGCRMKVEDETETVLVRRVK